MRSAIVREITKELSREEPRDILALYVGCPHPQALRFTNYKLLPPDGPAGLKGLMLDRKDALAQYVEGTSDVEFMIPLDRIVVLRFTDTPFPTDLGS